VTINFILHFEYMDSNEEENNVHSCSNKPL
jgi:hypothetical protein